MRTAEICPTCATYENALCIIYDGPYLSNIDVTPLDSIESALESINDNLVPVVGIVAPTANAKFIGQLYVNTAAPALYFAKSVGLGASDWVLL
jgi:hypothetical protein